MRIGYEHACHRHSLLSRSRDDHDPRVSGRTLTQHYCDLSTRTRSLSPRSVRICRSSLSMFCANCEPTLTEKSMPTLRSSPDRSLGRILVPSRFQTSGGTVPARRSVGFRSAGCWLWHEVPGSGSGSGSGSVLGAGPGCGCAGSPGVVLRSSALALVSRKTLDSNATSSWQIGFAYHRRP